MIDLIKEGLNDYADDCEEEATEQARIDAENRQIIEDIFFADFEEHLRKLSDRELIDDLVSARSKCIIDRVAAELHRRDYLYECELERQIYADEDEDAFGEY